MRLIYFSHSKSEYIFSQAALRLLPLLPSDTKLKERWNIARELAIAIGFICWVFANGSGEALTPDNSARGQVEQAPQDMTGEAASRERIRLLPAWWPPTPPAAAENFMARDRMVRTQIEKPGFFTTPVTRPSVLNAMRAVPRHVFVPGHVRGNAYDNTPLPIGYGQTISQPYIVAIMTELVEIGPNSKVLEIGTGSGYQAAVLAHLTPLVYSLEILQPLAEQSRNTLYGQGYEVMLRHGDGYYGWIEEAPFDAIIVTCAAGHLPPPLWEQLKPGGRIVIPIGGPYSVQRLVVIEKTKEGKRKSRSVIGARFVPMQGRASQP